jgi:hypothetical protein
MKKFSTAVLNALELIALQCSLQFLLRKKMKFDEGDALEVSQE